MGRGQSTSASASLVSDRESATLPGVPPPIIAAIWGQLSGLARAALRPHLLGETSADWLANTLTDEGFPVGASTIRTYRRALRQIGA